MQVYESGRDVCMNSPDLLIVYISNEAYYIIVVSQMSMHCFTRFSIHISVITEVLTYITLRVRGRILLHLQ